MAITLEDFQEAAKTRTVEPGKRPVPYSEELKSFAIKYTNQQLARGISKTAISRELGVSFQTLKTWYDIKEQTSGGFRQVSICDTSSQYKPHALVSPNGYRVEGLSLDDVATLFGKLG